MSRGAGQSSKSLTKEFSARKYCITVQPQPTTHNFYGKKKKKAFKLFSQLCCVIRKMKKQQNLQLITNQTFLALDIS